MAEFAILEKKKKRIEKENKQRRQGKRIKQYIILTKEVINRISFQISGDITINIDQLLNRSYSNQNIFYNEFISVNSVQISKQYDWVDTNIDTDFQVRHDLSAPLQILRNSQRQDIFDLVNALEEYQKVLKEKVKQSSTKYQQQQLTQDQIQSQEPNVQLACDEQNGWNFQKSAEKAQKIIINLQEYSKNKDNHYSFVLFKGNKYDQSISKVGNSTCLLKNFLCLNENQISYLFCRMPGLYFLKYQNQQNEYLLHRIQNQIKFLRNDKSELDQYRQGPKLVNECTIDKQSVDNLCVNIQTQHYLYVLSNYKNQVDDALWVCYHQPIRDQSASEVLSGMRNLKKYLSKEEEKSKLNPFYNGQLYSDIIYEAQSELFRDKFYSIIDNNVYHSISQYL
ncbi:hypothetical protein ABPG74_019881 [Tetrahymena malaccensis]